MTRISKISVAGGAMIALALSTSSAWAPIYMNKTTTTPKVNLPKINTPKLNNPSVSPTPKFTNPAISRTPTNSGQVDNDKSLNLQLQQNMSDHNNASKAMQDINQKLQGDLCPLCGKF